MRDMGSTARLCGRLVPIGQSILTPFLCGGLTVTANDKNAIVIFIKKIYIVKKLKTKILLNNDILDSEQISINVEKQVLTIDNCKNIKIQLNVTNTNSSIKRVVRVNEIIKISVKSITTESFRLSYETKTTCLLNVILCSRRHESND